MLVVADASAIVEYLFRTERAQSVERIIVDPDVQLHAPALSDVEVLSACRRATLRGKMDGNGAALVLSAYLDLPLVRHGHEMLVARALALREDFTAYDAMYVALAEALGATLLTADRRLVRAARRHTDLEVVSAAA